MTPPSLFSTLNLALPIFPTSRWVLFTTVTVFLVSWLPYFLCGIITDNRVVYGEHSLSYVSGHVSRVTCLMCHVSRVTCPIM